MVQKSEFACGASGRLESEKTSASKVTGLYNGPRQRKRMNELRWEQQEWGYGNVWVR